MSFKLGTFETTDIAGFKATLTEWPSLPVELSLEELPVGDGSLFYRARMTEKEWTFALELTGTDVDDVMAKADQVSLALNPKLGGIQDFTPNPAGDEWVWQGVLASPIAWERDSVLWFAQEGICRMAGEATIVTPDPYGYAAVAPVTRATAGTLTLTGAGNTSFRPRIEFRGTLSSTQYLALDTAMHVTGPLLVSETMVLDFNTLDFYIKNTTTGVKVRNIGDRITDLTIFEGVSSLAIPLSISGGSFVLATGIVSSRRI